MCTVEVVEAVVVGAASAGDDGDGEKRGNMSMMRQRALVLTEAREEMHNTRYSKQ